MFDLNFKKSPSYVNLITANKMFEISITKNIIADSITI